ncbi:MAG: PAS domain S-box protein [Candidatus Thermoplasmatota archaeon]
MGWCEVSKEPDIVRELRLQEQMQALHNSMQTNSFLEHKEHNGEQDTYHLFSEIEHIIHDTSQYQIAHEHDSDTPASRLTNIEKLLYEITSDLMVYLDARGRVIMVNPAARTYSGFSDREVVGQPFWRIPGLLHGNLLLLALRIFKNVLLGQHLKNVPVEFYDKEQRKHLLNVSTYPIKENNRLRFILVVGKDITSQREDLEKFRNLVERANDGILIIKDSIVRYVNPRLAEMWGGTVEEIIGTSFLEYVDPTERKKILQYYKQRLEGRSVPVTYETVLIRKDGKKVYADINAGLIPYEGGNADFVIIRDKTQEKESEKRVRESEQRYRTIFHHAADGIIILDNKNTIYDINQTALEISGYSREELVGRNIRSLSDIIEKGTFFTMIQNNIKRKLGMSVDPYEVKIITKKGDVRDVEINAVPYTLENGTQGLLAVLRDVTQRKKAEATLIENEERYRSLFEQTYDMIQSVDLQGHFMYVNPAWMAILGYSKEELSKLVLTDIIHAEDLPKCVELFSRVLGGEKIQHIETKFITKDGAAVLVEGNAIPRYCRGKVIGTQGIFRDITQRKKAETELKKSEKRFRDLAELLPESIFESDLQGKITYGNKKAFTLFGYEPSDLDKGLYITQLLDPKELQKFKENYYNTLSGKSSHGNEYIFVKKDGTKIPMMIYSVPIYEDTSVVGTRGVAVDLTELKKAYTEIEQLLKMKDEFINQLGHDLKTPLSPLVNLLPMVLEREQDAKSRERLQVAISCVNYMKDLVVKTIELAKLNSDKIEFEFETVDIGSLVQSIINRDKYLFEGKQITIENHITSPLLVTVDRLRIEEVFDNLLSNARKYTVQHPGKIILRSSITNDTLTISVTDTGVGLREDQRELIFQEFYKGDSSRHELDSSGLGLSITKRIIEKHGGKIWAESPGIGKGTTMFFTLPMNKRKDT